MPFVSLDGGKTWQYAHSVAIRYHKVAIGDGQFGDLTIHAGADGLHYVVDGGEEHEFKKSYLRIDYLGA